MTADAARACPVCPQAGPGRRIGSLANTVRGSFSRESFGLAYCPCGELVYLDPAPTPEDLRRMYVESEQFSDALYTEPQRTRAVVDYMRSCFERIRRTQDGSGTCRVLEVGAGFAWMCHAAREIDAGAVTVAQDVSAEAAQRCPWVDHYVVGDVGHPEIARRAPYDIISLTHVIEHLVDPVAMAALCRELLAAGGVLFLTAPHRPADWTPGSTDLGPWRRYSYLHVPAHVQYFARASVERLAARAGLVLAHWDAGHEGGQAFEAWLRAGPAPAGWRRLLRRWLGRDG